MKKLLLMLLISLFLFGCVSVSDAQKISKPSSEVKIFENAQNDCADVGGPTPCTCMVCQNKTTTPWWFSIFLMPVETSLKGGNCSFVQCNSTIFVDLVNMSKSDNLFPQKFLLGQGASFAEFKGANKYCNNSLSLAVKWMVGSTNAPPKIPSGSRAACLLERNVIPLYIYYTNGSNINEQAARDIGAALKDAGPTIVTPEINFNSSDPIAVAKVKSQIRAYKAACPSCLVAFSPKDMDMQAVDTFMRDSSVNSSIDIIGQGIILNEGTNGTCDIEALIGKRMAFAKKVLNVHHKPTMWLYVGISNGTQDMRENPGCAFTNISVAKAYEYITGLMQPLISSGVIGYSPYMLLDGTAPLECKGDACNFGLADTNKNPKEPQFSSWFSNCQYYTQEGAPSYISYSTNGLGNRCSYADNYKMFTRLVSEAGDAYIPPDLDLQEVDSRIACDACVSNSSLPRSFGRAQNSIEESFCTAFPQADVVPDRFDVPPLLMRAIFAKESMFNPCAISYVPPSTPSCGNFDAARINWGSYSTPQCPNVRLEEKYVDLSVGAGGDPSSQCKYSSEIASGNRGARCKPCAFGLAQCIELPGREYAPASIPGEIAQCNGAGYNPFSPGDSACCGATKMYSNLRDANALASRYALLRSAPEKDWYVALFALMSYHGDAPGGIAPKFFDGSLSDDDCFKSHNATLIDYLSSCRASKVRYALDVLAKYEGLVGKCENDCLAG